MISIKMKIDWHVIVLCFIYSSDCTNMSIEVHIPSKYIPKAIFLSMNTEIIRRVTDMQNE